MTHCCWCVRHSHPALCNHSSVVSHTLYCANLCHHCVAQPCFPSCIVQSQQYQPAASITAMSAIRHLHCAITFPQQLCCAITVKWSSSVIHYLRLINHVPKSPVLCNHIPQTYIIPKQNIHMNQKIIIEFKVYANSITDVLFSNLLKTFT